MNTNPPLISVIVPIYNVAKYLPRCVDSICNQTYQNLEIILVDDGSTDNSLEICNQYADEDKRIRVLHQENKGVSSARNLGLDNVTGEFVTFVDADDWLVAHYVQRLFELIQTYHADIAIGGCLTIIESEKAIFPPATYQQRLVSKEEALIASPHKTSINIAGKLYRKTLLEDLYFDTNYSLGEDTLFFFHALQKATIIVSTDEKIYVYCRRPKSAMDMSPIQVTYSDFKVWEKIRQLSIQRRSIETIQKASLELAFVKAIHLVFLLLSANTCDAQSAALLREMSSFFNQYRTAIWSRETVGLLGKLFIESFLLSPGLLRFCLHLPLVQQIARACLARHKILSLR